LKKISTQRPGPTLHIRIVKCQLSVVVVEEEEEEEAEEEERQKGLIQLTSQI